MEQARVNGVRQNPNPLRLHSSSLQLAAQRFRNGEQQTSLSPNPPLHPACQWRAGQTPAVALLFVSEGRGYLPPQWNGAIPPPAKAPPAPSAVTPINEDPGKVPSPIPFPSQKT